MPKPLTGWRKGLGTLFTGMAGFGSPEAGREAYQNLFVRPGERGEARYKTALGQYNIEREERRKETETAKGKFRPAVLADEQGQPIAASFDPATGTYHDADGNVIANPKQWEKPQSVNMRPFVIEDPNNPGQPLAVNFNPATGTYHNPETGEAIAGVKAFQKGTPAHITYDSGIPVTVTKGENVYDVNDPKLPEELKPLVAAAQRAHGQHVTEQEKIALAGRAEKEETSGLKWVEYTEPKTNKRVAGPLSQARKAGATDMALLDAGEIRAIGDARRAVELITKQGTKPEEQGVMQLVDGLDKDGKLGIAASRLNSFLAGGVGTSPGDDPRIITLLDKTQLAMTLTMKAHFGLSGGRSPQMLQHFLDMANAKKMDGTTLRAGILAVNNYMADRAASPEGGAVGGGTEGKVGAVSDAIKKLRESKRAK
jgi:hypothetical protein